MCTLQLQLKSICKLSMFNLSSRAYLHIIRLTIVFSGSGYSFLLPSIVASLCFKVFSLIGTFVNYKCTLIQTIKPQCSTPWIHQ